MKIFLAFLILAASGCVASSADLSGSISSVNGANNSEHSLSASTVSGDYSAGRFTMVAISSSQAISIGISGLRPAAGATYPITDALGSGPIASFQYAEIVNSGHRVWWATSGTITVEAVAKDTIQLGFADVTAKPDSSVSPNTAQGTLDFVGGATARDVLGFQP